MTFVGMSWSGVGVSSSLLMMVLLSSQETNFSGSAERASSRQLWISVVPMALSFTQTMADD